MYYIESKKNNHLWISGIFISKQDAEFYFESIPKIEGIIHSLLYIEISNYPVYIVESEAFEITNIAGVRAAIEKVKIIEDSENIYLNLYRVNEDFQPKKPGSDYMGAIYHIHVMNGYLSRYHQYKDLDPFELSWK